MNGLPLALDILVAVGFEDQPEALQFVILLSPELWQKSELACRTESRWVCTARVQIKTGAGHKLKVLE